MPVQEQAFRYRSILGTRIDAVSYEEAAAQVVAWARCAESRYVCAANTHSVVEALDSAAFSVVMNAADLNTPDGMPLVWALNLLGEPQATRIYGPTLMLAICEAASQAGISVGLYGGTGDSLSDLCLFLRRLFPELRIACSIAPPFGPVSHEQDAAYMQQIVESRARILFVGIGCPKQEHWMSAHKGPLPAVMVGVGAAFDFHSGRVRQAPQWMQRLGMEWCFRLMMEPRRLWRRYAHVVPRFIALFTLQIAGFFKQGGEPGGFVAKERGG